MEISKEDWKHYREKIPKWQEDYMNRLNQEYISLLSSNEGNPSDKFWELEKRINWDKKQPGVIMEIRKSRAISDIAGLIISGVITYEELDGFSDKMKETVRQILVR